MDILNQYTGKIIFSTGSVNLRGANRTRANLTRANLTNADLRDADLTRADLRGANLRGADLTRANLRDTDLTRANLRDTDLRDTDLTRADLTRADLTRANLRGADLTRANLRGADLRDTDLRDTDLTNADLTDARGLVKLVGVIPGNCYWKRFNADLTNNGFRFHVGLNTLRPGEVFAADDRVLCSYPGFHVASRSWCAVNYPVRPYEALIRIPADAQVNEPWATDGKASADKIEILQVFCTKTGADVTSQFIREEK